MHAPTPAAVLDETIQRLAKAQPTWASRSFASKASDLDAVFARASEGAAKWVELAIQAKGVPVGSAGEGEEWVTGPWALLAALKAYARTLRALAAGDSPIPPTHVRTRHNGQVAIQAFPITAWDGLLLNGYHAEVWLRPDVDADAIDAHVANNLKRGAVPEGIALVLGAGNIASIAPLDVLYALVAQNRVALCKLNPVNDYLGEVLTRIFEPLVSRGFVAFAYGHADIGARLIDDGHVATVHITGSARSHDAIVFGNGDDGTKRKATNSPRMTKPISSELGGVGPTIVVPGPWSKADLHFQAEHIATQKLHNGGFNCIATQILLVHREWKQRDAFLNRIEAVMREVPKRPAYYPGALDRQRDAVAHCPQAVVLDEVERRTRLPELDIASERYAFNHEFFSAMWGEVSLEAEDAGDFLDRAVDFANQRLDGSLGAQIIIHPATIADLGPRFERAIESLKYGTIGINAWSGVAFLFPYAAWGAYPGHTLSEIQSGIGIVHNAYLLDATEKTVVRGPFAPFPRAAFKGEFHVSPKPAWFVTNSHAAQIGRLFCEFEASPGIGRFLPLAAAAFTAS